MKWLRVISFVFILVSASTFSQKYIVLPTFDVDSLMQILPGQVAEERVNSLNRLVISLFFDKTDASKTYADEAMSLATELNYEKGIADAHRSLGFICQFLGDFPQALNNYFEALALYEAYGEKYAMAWIYYDIAKTHWLVNNFEKTIEYGKLALDKFRERAADGTTIGNVRDTMSVLGGLAFIYIFQDSCEKSLELTLEYLDMGTKNRFGIPDMLLYLSLAGERYYCAGEKDSAIVYLEKALAYPNPDSDPVIEALKCRSISSLGSIYYREGDYDSALVYCKTAFDFYHKNGYLLLAGNESNRAGRLYYRKNDLINAEKYYLKTEQLFNECLTWKSGYRYDSLKYLHYYGLEAYFPIPRSIIKAGIWRMGYVMFYWLYKINEELGRSQKALSYHIAYSDANDTLYKLERNRETIELQARFETEQKEKQIEYLNREHAFTSFKLKQTRYFLLGLGMLVLMVIVLAIVLIRQNKLREQQKNLLLQQKLFRSQMNPHFLFNSLVGIQQFIISQQPDKAGKFLSKFSKLVRNILDSSFEEFVPLEEEINTIENYLELQKVRFTDKFDFSIDVDNAIDTETFMIPPMLAQPIIENAIEHGIKHRETKGNIQIRFRLDGNRLSFEVEDDGVGRKKAMEMMMQQDKDHKSLATAITHERILILNKKQKQKITMTILDLKDENDKALGTKVVFEIPVIQ